MRPSAKYFACALAAVFIASHAAFAQTPAPKKPRRSLENLVPIPVGKGAKGVWLPDREDGKLKMEFFMEAMEHTDVEHIQMTNAKITTYDDNEKVDLILLLPASIFNLKTQMLVTDKQFMLKKTNLELTGDSLQLDTVTKQATITGKVKMIIYNFDVPTPKEPAHE